MIRSFVLSILGRPSVLLAFVITSSVFMACNMGQKADRIFVNAKIWTGNEAQPYATAIAISGTSLLFVGSDEDVGKYRGSNTEVIDAEGSFIVPGFVDNHTHFLSGGFQLASVNLRQASTPAAFAELVESFAADAISGAWITGGDWDHEAWGGELPTREWIDDVTPDNPVFVNRLDYHMALANSHVLKLAGITRETPDPSGGTIVRDPETGEATGILKDEAMNLVYAIMPDPPDESFDSAFLRAQSHALERGVTQIHDVGSYGGWQDLEVFSRIKDRGQLEMRIYSLVNLSTWERLREYISENGKGDEWLRWGGLKTLVDGSLGSTTGLFYEPYADAPHTSGLFMGDSTAIRTQILGADAAGLQLAIHAIGDKANDWVLDVLDDVVQINGVRDRRSRIEHAQHLIREAINRMGRGGIIPSVQPYHAVDDGRWAEKRVGPVRIKTTYPFRSLLDAGAMVTFGSDWTVAPLSPLLGIEAAVTRATIDGLNPDGWIPEQRISVEEALHAYTSSNAYAGFMEDRSGSLAEGMLADFVVLSKNLFDVPGPQLSDVAVLRTVIGGVDRYVAEPSDE